MGVGEFHSAEIQWKLVKAKGKMMKTGKASTGFIWALLRGG